MQNSSLTDRKYHKTTNPTIYMLLNSILYKPHTYKIIPQTLTQNSMITIILINKKTGSYFINLTVGDNTPSLCLTFFDHMPTSEYEDWQSLQCQAYR